MRRIIAAFGWLLGIYLVGRAVGELLLVDYGDPASYRDDWGGPGLAGVLALHTGLGLLAAALMVTLLVRRRSRAASGPRP